MFENRNLHDAPGFESMGIWTVLDDVRVVDAGPLPALPGPHRSYLPLVMSRPICDPVVSGVRGGAVVRPGGP